MFQILLKQLVAEPRGAVDMDGFLRALSLDIPMLAVPSDKFQLRAGKE